MDLRPEVCRTVLVVNRVIHRVKWSDMIFNIAIVGIVLGGSVTFAGVLAGAIGGRSPSGWQVARTWLGLVVGIGLIYLIYLLPKAWRRLVAWAETPERIARNLDA